MAFWNKNISYFEQERRKRERKAKTEKVLLTSARHIVPIIAVIVILIPILAILIASFKNHDTYQSSGAFEITGGLTLDNYKEALFEGNLLRGFATTLFISVVSIIATIFMGSMTAYILTRFKFIGSKLISTLFLIASFMPSITMQISIFHIIDQLDIYNTYAAVILIYAGTDIMSIYIFQQYLKGIPKAVDESALIDGASYFMIYRKIILPLLRPAMVSVIILKGIAFYNDFFITYLYLPTSNHAGLSTALYKFSSKFGGRWEVIAAGIIITMLPTLVAFLLFRKQIYSGVAQSAGKS